MDYTPADVFPWRDYLTAEQAVGIATDACTRMDESPEKEVWTSIVRDHEEKGVPWLFTSEAIHLGSTEYCPEHFDALQTDVAETFDVEAWMASPGNHPPLPPLPFVIDMERRELVPNPEYHGNTTPAPVDEYIEDAEPGNSEIVARQARDAELARDMDEGTAADPGGNPAPDPVNHLYPVSWADGVTVHTETRKGSEAVQWLPHEAVVHIVCRVKGEAAETRTGRTTHWWDWIDYPVSGFITDARINTGGYPPDVPLCQ